MERPQSRGVGLLPPSLLGLSLTTTSCDTDIDTTATRLGAVEGQQSALGRLPPELLCVVFEELASTAPVQPRIGLSLPDKLGWTIVEQVCQHWRATALGHKTLWTRIDAGPLSPRDTLDRFAHRAGSLPFTANCSSPHFPGPNILPLIRALALHRFRSTRWVLDKLASSYCCQLEKVEVEVYPIPLGRRCPSPSAPRTHRIAPRSTGLHHAGLARPEQPRSTHPR